MKNVKIIKRDGTIQNFDQNKIIDAVLAAFQEVDNELNDYAYVKAGNIADYILDKCNEYYNEEIRKGTSKIYLNVEEIQDLVEKGLMATKRKDVAKAYILYRDKRNAERNRNAQMTKTIREKLSASNVQNQNANVDEHSFGGRMGEANSAMTRQIALDYIVSPMARENHLDNMIYIHDLDHYAVGDHNCLSVPFDDLLAKGFNTRQTDVRPAGSVNTAFQLVAVIFQLQSLQQFGGVSATHLDWTMVPYVRKSFVKHYKDGLMYIDNIQENEIDYEIENMLINATEYSIEDDEYKAYNYKAYEYALKMTERETKQAVEGMYHNLK